MRIWMIVVPCTYVALLLILAAPAVTWSFDVEWRAGDPGVQAAEAVMKPDWSVLRGLLGMPWFYLWLAALLLAQVALLLPCGKPVDRPRARRRLRWSLASSAFLAGLLFACLGVALLFGIWGDAPFDQLDEMASDSILSTFPGSFVTGILILFSPLVTAWALWWWILHKATRGRPSPRFPEKAARWLIAGSVLEFLVAVPCHVATRNRDDCCAPYPTFFGLATGIAVALLCCGPTLLILVRDRVRRKRPRSLPAITHPS